METATSPIATPQTFRTSRGRSTPLGATPLAEGVNFVLMCRHGVAVSLVLQSLESNDILAEIPLDPRKHGRDLFEATALDKEGRFVAGRPGSA